NNLALDKTSKTTGNGVYTSGGEIPAIVGVPLKGQDARIRIPMAIHQRKTDNLNQGGLNIGDNYLPGGNSPKHTIDSGFYTRPEIPLEFVLKLRSREAKNNTDADQLGLFEPEAVGPARLEPIAEDHYIDSLYNAGDLWAEYTQNA